VLAYFRDHWLINSSTEDSLNTLNLQVLISALNTVKTEYGSGADFIAASILDIGYDAINRGSPMRKFYDQWNFETFHYLGPVALIKVLNAILTDAMNSIKRKIIMSMRNPIAFDFIMWYIRASKGSLMHTASRILVQPSYFVDETTQLRTVSMSIRVD
jgi:hypothetical protein